MARPHPALIELAACRPPPRRVVDPDGLVSSAVEHRMHGLLWSAVERCEIDLPVDIERRLAALLLGTRRHHARLWAALEEVTTLLADHGIEVATFKGVTAEHRWYDRMGERPSRDLDLWLAPHQLHRAAEVVRLLHPAHPLVNDVQLLVDRRQLQSVDLSAGGVAVDLHFDPVKLGVWVPNLAHLWNRSVHIEGFRTLSHDDAAVQFLSHALKDRFSWLISLADIPRVIDTENRQRSVIRVATEAGLQTIIQAALWNISQHLSLAHLAERRPSVLWRLIWPMRAHLNGSIGILRGSRRQHILPLLASNFEAANVLSFYRSLLFPHPTLLNYRHPDLKGTYAAKVVFARLRSHRERLAALKAAGSGDPRA